MLKKYFKELFVIWCFLWSSTHALDVKEWMGDEPLTVKRIVTEVIEYFSQDDPHGIPVLKIPEPLSVPNQIAAGPITLSETEITGHSEIRLDYINVNLTTMSAVARVSVPELNSHGQYEWPGWWSTSKGVENITMTDIQLSVEVSFGINDAGILTADSVSITWNYEKLYLDFTGLGTDHFYMVNAADLFFSSIIQPIIVGTLQDTLTKLISTKLETALKEKPFPDSVSPVDYSIAKIRRGLRQKGLDPYVLGDKEVNMAWDVSLLLKGITLHGLTTIHRTHEVSAEFIDNAIFATLQVGTQDLKGGADWSISAALLPAVSGRLEFEIESLEITVELKQPANVRSPPVLRKIDVHLGNLAVRSAGESTMDYAVELLVNILPNLFRNIIMDKVEPKLHQVIQKNLNRLDLHRIIMERLDKREQ